MARLTVPNCQGGFFVDKRNNQGGWIFVLQDYRHGTELQGYEDIRG